MRYPAAFFHISQPARVVASLPCQIIGRSPRWVRQLKNKTQNAEKKSKLHLPFVFYFFPFGMVLGFGIEPNHTHQRPGYGGRGRGRTPAPIPNRRGGYCRRHPAEEACGNPKGQRFPCYYYTIIYRIVPRKPVFLPNLWTICPSVNQHI